MKKADKITDMKQRMSDIYLAVSWREIARTYFDKSVPWFQHKMYGIDGNGGVGGFTEEQDNCETPSLTLATASAMRLKRSRYKLLPYRLFEQ